MSRLEVALLLICLHAGYVYGGLFDCNFEFLERDILDHMVFTCPRLFETREKQYCCVDVMNKRNYCCTFLEFMQTTGLGLILPLGIAGIVVVCLLACCISCFCCSCCPWYRRNRGTIYGRPGLA